MLINLKKFSPVSPLSPLNNSNFLDTKIIRRNPRYPRKQYLNKLKTKIKKLKNSKIYYKKLCHTLTQSKNINNNLNSALLTSLKKSNKSSVNLTHFKQNFNIFNSFNPNIINNITIKNNNQFLYKLNNKESSNDSESSNNNPGERKYNSEEIKINNEINIFYKAKYINLDKYTSGEFSKNEKLRKQSLNFIKVFIEIEKKKKKKLGKLKKTPSKSIQNKNLENPYINNYDFRYILSKLKLNRKKQKSYLNTPKTIIVKKEKNSIIPFLLTVNTDKKSNNTSIILNKNNYSKRSSKKTLSKQTKKRSPKNNNSIKETFFSHNKIDINKNILNDKDKFDNSRNELKEKKDKNGFLKLPIKTKTIDEWENENIINKSTNENDLNKSKSINSDDNNNNHSI